MKSKKIIELIFNSVVLIIFVWLAYEAFYDLFINEPHVHYARISVQPTGNGTKIVTFLLSAPTIADFIILCCSLFSICSIIMVYIIILFKLNIRTKINWIIQLSCLLISILSSIYMFFHFINTAFQGVG
jgi:hypothetical protein